LAFYTNVVHGDSYIYSGNPEQSLSAFADLFGLLAFYTNVIHGDSYVYLGHLQQPLLAFAGFVGLLAFWPILQKLFT
jgi:hypothetical protein